MRLPEIRLRHPRICSRATAVEQGHFQVKTGFVNPVVQRRKNPDLVNGHNDVGLLVRGITGRQGNLWEITAANFSNTHFCRFFLEPDRLERRIVRKRHVQRF